MRIVYAGAIYISNLCELRRQAPDTHLRAGFNTPRLIGRMPLGDAPSPSVECHPGGEATPDTMRSRNPLSGTSGWTGHRLLGTLLGSGSGSERNDRVTNPRGSP